jgi:hypothetical protein
VRPHRGRCACREWKSLAYLRQNGHRNSLRSWWYGLGYALLYHVSSSYSPICNNSMQRFDEDEEDDDELMAAEEE